MLLFKKKALKAVISVVDELVAVTLYLNIVALFASLKLFLFAAIELNISECNAFFGGGVSS